VSLRNALAHLTALRIPPRRRVPLVHSLHYFPWVSAAHGSLNILVFLAALRVLPVALACLVAVILPQVLAGFGPWRGVLEALRGIKTLPGHNFHPGFRPDLPGLGLIAGITVVNWVALMLMTPDWRVRAVLLYPIVGVCAHTASFLLAATPSATRNVLVARRRIRAGFLSGALLFLVFLFPLRAAAFILVTGALAAFITLSLRHPRQKGQRWSGLTLQTAGLITAVTETTVLVSLVIAELFFFP